MPNITTNRSYILFADDTNIFISGKSLCDISIVLNNELNKIDLWLKNNKLSLNVTKHDYNIIREEK